jgi:hypothetical protein
MKLAAFLAFFTAAVFLLHAGIQPLTIVLS